MQKEVYWSRFADNFDELTRYVVGKADLSVVLDMLAQQRALGKTLELGCGTGIYSKVVANQATELLATDFSDEMVGAAKGRLHGLANTMVEKQNCLDVTFPDGSFDTVVLANLLHVIPQPQQALAEVKRVLRPDGRVILISYTSEGMTFANKLGMIYRYLRAWGKPSPHAKTLYLAKAKEMLAAQGFEIDQARLVGLRNKAIFITALRR